MNKEYTHVKGKRYSEEQIIKILREAEAGMSAADVCRKHGVSEWSFYRWRQKYGGVSGGAGDDPTYSIMHAALDQRLIA